MFVIIYQFEVRKGMKAEFIAAWEEMTQLIYQYEGSLGSRLHRKSDNVYMAYAQWPDKEAWQKAGGKLPDFAGDIRERMRASCLKVETLHELECVKDLLKEKAVPPRD